MPGPGGGGVAWAPGQATWHPGMATRPPRLPPLPRRLLQEKKKAFSSYKDYLGKDITSLVILPVWIMQPFTMLQNMAEIMEYTDALDKAAATEDPYERCARRPCCRRLALDPSVGVQGGGGGAGCMVVVTLVVDRLLGMLPTNTCAGTCGTPHQAAVHVQ